jgi:hypothetical protein
MPGRHQLTRLREQQEQHPIDDRDRLLKRRAIVAPRLAAARRGFERVEERRQGVQHPVAERIADGNPVFVRAPDRPLEQADLAGGLQRCAVRQPPQRSCTAMVQERLREFELQPAPRPRPRGVDYAEAAAGEDQPPARAGGAPGTYRVAPRVIGISSPSRRSQHRNRRLPAPKRPDKAIEMWLDLDNGVAQQLQKRDCCDIEHGSRSRRRAKRSFGAPPPSMQAAARGIRMAIGGMGCQLRQQDRLEKRASEKRA